MLAVLLQGQPENQIALGKADGILPLLTAASHFKRREPADAEEVRRFTRPSPLETHPHPSLAPSPSPANTI